jgi:hypothetical protein
MERRLGDDPAVTIWKTTTKLMRLLIAAALLATLSAGASRAQDLGVRPLRYGNTSGWSYDNRDDNRDFTTNGFFPGNFTADPPSAWLGAAGVLAGNSYRSPAPYPSQVVIGPQPAHAICGWSGRSRDRSFVGSDGIRHRC